MKNQDTHIRISFQNKEKLKDYQEKWCLKSINDVISVLLEVADTMVQDGPILVESRIYDVTNNHTNKRLKLNDRIKLDYEFIKHLFDNGYDIFIEGIDKRRASYIKSMIKRKTGYDVLYLEGEFNDKFGFFFFYKKPNQISS